MADTAPVAALQTALTGADAAIYAYGLVGPSLVGAERSAALAAMATHRGNRDRLRVLLLAAGAVPGPAAAAYDPPFPITGAASARRLAALVEDRSAGQLAAAAAVLSGPDRAWAATVAQSCAVRQVTWAGAAPVWSGTT